MKKAKTTTAAPPTSNGQDDDTTPRPPAGVLERGISILECFREDRLRMSLRELAECSGLDKATLLRLLGVLLRARMVHRFENGSYAPGPALLHMGMLYRSTFDLGTRLQPVLHAVMEQTGETVAFYIRSGDDRVCLYRENTLKEVRHHVEVGTRIPLKAGGSSAHILLSFTGSATPHQAEIDAKGYAMTRAERVDEMASVALPVFDGDGTFLGAMVVIGLASRHNVVAQRKAADIVRRELALQGFVSAPPSNWRRPAA
ncbi:IclR family transcriptional regulator [Hydrogenophaga laconesensis]|uniref:DNA-binding IclR family transcriptional regulator n=1 Tax=Hydrogenophaga laconesensis TaxID=1805971 RepID=A0ABU1VBY0_9BURK|nr:helix-turn-helix domain-containing protein [Hydrogenophaga laconesensis]MDR7094890.1 DNA-binding IclR family transcriptional regulator [Hydrogenophaga laconesensis]